MRKDGARDPFGIAELAQNLATAKRMILWRRPTLVVEVVKQTDNAPLALVLAKRPRIAADRRFNTHRMLQQAVAPGVFVQQPPGILSIHGGLVHLNAGGASPHQRPIAFTKTASRSLENHLNG